MSSYSIANERIPDDALRNIFSEVAEEFCLPQKSDLYYIFETALKNRSLFPNINTKGANDPELYLGKWVKDYIDAMNSLPSEKSSSPKSSCTDPAIRIIVQSAKELTEEVAVRGESIHNLFMSAENIQGNLLEEYISTKIRPYGFLWCNGNILRAVDFCNTDGSLLLQVKNTSNTENSSSSNIRVGTSIKKWFRLGTKTRQGVKYPDYKWSGLNSIVNDYRTEGFDLLPCDLSEDEYQAFLKTVSAYNKQLITEL